MLTTSLHPLFLRRSVQSHFLHTLYIFYYIIYSTGICIYFLHLTKSPYCIYDFLDNLHEIKYTRIFQKSSSSPSKAKKSFTGCSLADLFVRLLCSCNVINYTYYQKNYHTHHKIYLFSKNKKILKKDSLNWATLNTPLSYDKSFYHLSTLNRCTNNKQALKNIHLSSQ